jgi:hypothetical protein
MSEYESAVSDALSVAFTALVRHGTDPEELRRGLHEHADSALERGAITCAATLQLMARYCVPDRSLLRESDSDRPSERFAAVDV